MSYTIVRYTVAPEHIADNERLVQAVFAQLHDAAPNGVRYASLHLGEGRFMHVVGSDTGDTSPLTDLPAFKAFSSGIHQRCTVMPESTEAHIVGNHHLLPPSR